MAAPTGVVVVDDHLAFAELLALAIGEQPDLRCLGHAVNARQAQALVARVRPDVVLMDVELQDADGIALTRQLRRAHPNLQVVVLTSHNDMAVAARAAAAGAGAFVPKEAALGDVLAALRGVRDGTMMIAPATLARGARTRPPGPALTGGGDRLTSREMDVLRLLAQGRDSTAIAHHLGISGHTCRGYLKGLFAKLGAHSQLEAVVTAVRRGLIDIDDGTPGATPGTRPPDLGVG